MSVQEDCVTLANSADLFTGIRNAGHIHLIECVSMCFLSFILPPTLENLKGHIALACPCVRLRKI